MDLLIIAQVLRGIQAATAWFVQTRGGNDAEALDVVEGYLKRPGSRLDPEVFDIVKMAAAGLQFLSTRGISTKEARALLESAEGRDLTDDEVDDFLADTRQVLERVEDKIARMEADEAAAAAAQPEPAGEDSADDGDEDTDAQTDDENVPA